jgi:hypothetical protein
MEAAPKPDSAPETAPTKGELPNVESPPLSPGSASSALAADAPESVTTPLPAAACPRLIVKAGHKRYALLAATVALAAAVGVVAGALASRGFPAPARSSAVTVEENRAMRQSIAELGKDIAAMKAGLEHKNGSAHSQVAKISERLNHAAAEVTGSIAASGTVQSILPLPLPKLAPRAAASESWAPVSA